MRAKPPIDEVREIPNFTQVETYGAMMKTIGTIMTEIYYDKLDPEIGRLLLTGVKQQLKLMDLGLQARRLYGAMRNVKDLPTLPEAELGENRGEVKGTRLPSKT